MTSGEIRLAWILTLVVSAGCSSGGGSSGAGIIVENFPTPDEVTLSSGLNAYALGIIASTFRVDTGIAVNSRGETHLLFTGFGGSTGSSVLYYVTNEDGQWRLIKQWGRRQTGRENGIAVDVSDYVHIISESTAGVDEDLTYATNVSGAWQDATLDHGSSLGLAGDIWIDPIDGSIHISHWQWLGDDLRYTTDVFGTWQNYEISGSWTWNSTSVFTDSAGGVHIFAQSVGGVEHISNLFGEGGLSVEQVGPPTSSDVSASIDSDDNIWLLTKEGLGFKSSDSNIWLFIKIFDAWPYRPAELDEDAFVVDANGDLHLCFSVFSSQEGLNRLVYATDAGGSLRHAVIDSTPSSFGASAQPSLAVDRGGNVHVIFVDPDGQVFYTSFDPTTIL